LSKTFIFDNETYAQYSQARVRSLQTFLPELQRRLEFDGIETKPMSPQEFTAFVEAETTRWAPLAKSLAAANAEQ